MHGVGGALGIVMLGLLGTTAVNASGQNGLFYGNPGFFVKQVVAILGSSVYAFGFTWLMLAVINRVTPVRTSEVEEQRGLDDTLHGETAYEQGI